MTYNAGLFIASLVGKQTLKENLKHPKRFFLIKTQQELLNPKSEKDIYLKSFMIKRDTKGIVKSHLG